MDDVFSEKCKQWLEEKGGNEYLRSLLAKAQAKDYSMQVYFFTNADFSGQGEQMVLDQALSTFEKAKVCAISIDPFGEIPLCENGLFYIKGKKTSKTLAFKIGRDHIAYAVRDDVEWGGESERPPVKDWEPIDLG